MSQLAYGFVQLRHRLEDRVEDVGVRTVYDAVISSAQRHSDMVRTLLSMTTRRTTEYKKRFIIPGNRTLQPLDESGNPRPRRQAGHYDVAFPLQMGGDAVGTTWIARAEQTVEEVNSDTLTMLKADADWMKRRVLAALLTDAAWTFIDERHGSLSIQPLANEDGIEYPFVGSSEGEANHYLAQNNAISDANNPFPTIYETLKQHPSNGGDVVVFVPTNLTQSIMGLTAFLPVPDPRVTQGIANDRLNAGSLDGVRAFGDEVLGRVDKCWIVQWRSLPDNYMLATVTDPGSPVLAWREKPVPALQGLVPQRHSPDGNLEELRLIRIAGFGVENRVAAAVMRIGNSSYAIPSGFEAPLAV